MPPSRIWNCALSERSKGRSALPVTSVGIAAGRQEVEQLLSDIAESKGGYCSLQPVVVTRLADDEWELVDGQQRLTTLYLLYVYMQKAWLKNVGPRCSITYETRPASPSYLSELNEARNEDNIDFFPCTVRTAVSRTGLRSGTSTSRSSSPTTCTATCSRRCGSSGVTERAQRWASCHGA